jgi:hypothetical protein
VEGPVVSEAEIQTVMVAANWIALIVAFIALVVELRKRK